jgi:hypothetical protein
MFRLIFSQPLVHHDTLPGVSPTIMPILTDQLTPVSRPLAPYLTSTLPPVPTLADRPLAPTPTSASHALPVATTNTSTSIPTSDASNFINAAPTATIPGPAFLVLQFTLPSSLVHRSPAIPGSPPALLILTDRHATPGRPPAPSLTLAAVATPCAPVHVLLGDEPAPTTFDLKTPLTGCAPN